MDWGGGLAEPPSELMVGWWSNVQVLGMDSEGVVTEAMVLSWVVVSGSG
jgi:hypothetical protein